jgi:hypothetical protein
MAKPGGSVEGEVSDVSKLSHEYAWSWFEYHAGQRMSVFRFYMFLMALFAGGIIKTYEAKMFFGLFVLGVLLAFASFAFWRLDVRSADLIKIAERYLAESENALSKFSGDKIKFTKEAESKDNDFARAIRFRGLSSFRIIFQYIFWIAISCGVSTAIIGVVNYCNLW